jgi:threonylcarbamoyladenosine tRNA methylthiotransferase MtaB
VVGRERHGRQRFRLLVRSLGCKVNLADAAAVVEQLDSDCVGLVDDPGAADALLLNTCTVTHRADRDARKILGGLAAKWPRLPVVVTGCGAVRCPERLAEFDNVRAVFEPGQPRAVAAALGAPLAAGPGPSPFMRLGRRRAFAKIQDGCNAHCRYCIIPRVRGAERSLPLASAVALVGDLLDRGHREVVLTGIHLGRYRADSANSQRPVRLAGLIDALAPVFGDRRPQARLRLSSIEPLELGDELLDAIARSPFVCRHFHVPLQSGDDGVLEAMGRPYRAAAYRRIVAGLRRRFPQAAIGADVLVGHPGEDETAAANTLALLADVPVDYLHVFPYSPRPHTPAARDHRPGDEAQVRERAARLRRLGERRWQAFTAAGVGRLHRLLVERVDAAGARGRSEHYRRIRLAGTPAAAAGGILTVRADACSGDELRAAGAPGVADATEGAP